MARFGRCVQVARATIKVKHRGGTTSTHHVTETLKRDRNFGANFFEMKLQQLERQAIKERRRLEGSGARALSVASSSMEVERMCPSGEGTACEGTGKTRRCSKPNWKKGSHN